MLCAHGCNPKRRWTLYTLASALANVCSYSERSLTVEEVDYILACALKLHGIGAYVGSHCVRSILCAFDITVAPTSCWGKFTFSNRSVGKLVSSMGNPSPAEVVALLKMPCEHHCVGKLALLLCELHQILQFLESRSLSAQSLCDWQPVDVITARQRFHQNRKFTLETEYASSVDVVKIIVLHKNSKRQHKC